MLQELQDNDKRKRTEALNSLIGSSKPPKLIKPSGTSKPVQQTPKEKKKAKTNMDKEKASRKPPKNNKNKLNTGNITKPTELLEKPEIAEDGGRDLLECGQPVSFDSNTTITEIEEVFQTDSDSSDSDDGDEYPVVRKIISGYQDKKNKLCMIKLTYEKRPTKVVDCYVGNAVHDDEHHVVLHWVMENKWKAPIWKEQAEVGILNSKSIGGIHKDWVDWTMYVKQKVEDGILTPACLGFLEDGGGKPKSKPISETVEAESPLKEKKTRCNHCFFKEETNKCTAKRSSGYILDGIVCEGYPNSCGKEFVMFEHEASCKAKALVPQP